MAAKFKIFKAKKDLFVLVEAMACIAAMVALGVWLLCIKTGEEQASVVGSELLSEQEMVAMEENIVIEDEETPLASGETVVADDENSVNTAKAKPGKQEKPAKPVKPEKPAKPEKEEKPSKDENQKPGNNKPGNEKPAQKEKYHLIWEDNFNGDSLNREDWNVELHAPGWVNAEWQEYVDSEANIYVEDGKLVIRAVKTVDENGNAYYTSGRVNTQNKHDFKYGKFEARIKVPSGKGFLPAFWMMPTDESYYGQWPKCGEIDIMEVMGQSTDTLHGTIHFGEPHTQKQGTFVSKKANDFSDKFHVFSCEWEPGEIRWYVDGQLYYTANDWFTAKPGFDEVAYPAPFDQPYYMILNLAVGGSWVGYPDETTEFGDNAQLVVDYVKVYQKESYDENVTKPEKAPIEFKEPDATGNYVLNSDFSVNEDLTDDNGWKFLLAGSGEATASISDNTLHVVTTNAGDLDYSVQVVQPGMSLQQGKRYRMSYDMYADEARTAIASVTAPDYNYVRYLEDTKVNVTTEKQTFTHEFDMTVRDDVNGRVEFNLGNQGSTATLHISNVRLEVIGECELPSDEKSVLPDGNYVYNGDFSYGANRLDYWNIPTANVAGSIVSVTNTDGVRELKVVTPDSVTELKQVVVEQKDIALTAGTKYVLTFDAHADRNNTFKACIAGSEFTCEVGTNGAEYAYSFVAGDNEAEYVLQFLLGTPGTTYIDNVRIQEDGMLVNGGFSNGLVGFETYKDASTNASFSVDELNEGGAACIDIKDTGDADWKIQLKQNNVTLEEGKWYKISFEAKSVTALGSAGTAFERDIMCALQRNGAVHKNPDGSEDWTPYLQKTVSLNGEYQAFDFVFQMMPGTEPKTDEGTILTFSMGAVGGRRITDNHIVVIDNVALEEVEAPEQEEIVTGENLITNGNFANDAEGWNKNVIWPAEGTVLCEDDKVTFDIINPGTADWNVKLEQKGMTIEHGATYAVKFNIVSSESRMVKWGLMTSTYDWYAGEDMNLTAGEVKQVAYTTTIEKQTTRDMDFYISMGKIDGEDTPACRITISDVSIVKISEGTGESPVEPDTPVTPEQPEANLGEELVTNGDFTNGQDNWEVFRQVNEYADVTFADGVVTFDVKNVGDADYHVQLKHAGISLKQGSTYQVSFDIKSSEARTVRMAILDPSYNWYGGTDVALEKDVVKNVSFQMVSKATHENLTYVLSMGKLADMENPLSVITVDNVSIREVLPETEPEQPDTPEEPEIPEAPVELVKNGDFSQGETEWWASYINTAEATATKTFTDGKAVFAIENAGVANWHVKLEQNTLALEQGVTYKVSFKIKSSIARKVDIAVQNASDAWLGGTTIDAGANPEEWQLVEFEVTPSGAANRFCVSMGQIDAETYAVHTIEIDNVSIQKK